MSFVTDIFRPYAGYQSCRILIKQSKQHPALTFLLCFVEFDTCVRAVSLPLLCYGCAGLSIWSTVVIGQALYDRGMLHR